MKIVQWAWCDGRYWKQVPNSVGTRMQMHPWSNRMSHMIEPCSMQNMQCPPLPLSALVPLQPQVVRIRHQSSNIYFFWEDPAWSYDGTWLTIDIGIWTFLSLTCSVGPWLFQTRAINSYMTDLSKVWRSPAPECFLLENRAESSSKSSVSFYVGRRYLKR